VDESGRLKRVAGRLGSQPGGGEVAKFVVNQRQQMSGGARIALIHRIQKFRNFAHFFTQV
jgi:hypothetical protein